MRRLLLSLQGVLSLLMGLGTAPSALTATTLTFDEFQTGTGVTNQYQNLGVLVSGATALAAAALAAKASAWPANTPPNIAYSPLGLMSFTLNPTIIGNVQSVSAYLSEGVGVNVGIYAYDASGALVGHAIAPADAVNTFVSVTSTGNPIATVQIHDGRGAFFGVDTVTFTTAADAIPIANGGPTRDAEVGHLVTLNGSKSYDPDTPPQPLAFLWTQVSGPAVTQSGATTATPTFRPSVAGVYVFSQVVNEGQSGSKPATVNVDVEPADRGWKGRPQSCSMFESSRHLRGRLRFLDSDE